MGTSTDSRGSKRGSALIPAHADSDPKIPQPPPNPDRFRQFRTAMRKFSSSGDSEARTRALGNYSQQVCGGSKTGARKFGAVARSGASAIAGLSELASGGDGRAATGSDISGALGAPIDVAAQIIADAIAPRSESRDRVRVAIEEAICTALEGETTLEADNITDELLGNILLNYLAEAVFQDVWLEAGDSTDGAVTSAELMQREADLREVARVAIDMELSKTLNENISSMSAADVENAQLQAVRAVLEHWEAYADD